jgi:hypothetical protein
LHKIRCFSHLAHRDLRRLCYIMTVKNCRKGDVLIREVSVAPKFFSLFQGDRPRGVHFLIKGDVKLLKEKEITHLLKTQEQHEKTNCKGCKGCGTVACTLCHGSGMIKYAMSEDERARVLATRRAEIISKRLRGDAARKLLDSMRR